MTSLPAAVGDRSSLVAAAIDRYRDEPCALLPLLHAIQEALGCVPDDAVAAIARGLGLSRAEVHGVLTYYPFFRREPPGRCVVQVCQAEACLACGADELMAHAERRLGCRAHETRADGAVTLEPVHCLGLCASSPAARIDDRLHARLSAERLDALLDHAGLTR